MLRPGASIPAFVILVTTALFGIAPLPSLADPAATPSSTPSSIPSATPSSNPPSPPIHTLYLIRHGIYDETDERPDSVGKGLTPLGIAQCRLVAERLRSLPVHIDHLYCSTLTRARESARVIGESFPQLPIEESWLLSECTPPTRRKDIMAKLDSTEAVDCRTKLETAWRTFATPADGADRTDVLVCHGNVIRYFVTRALDVDTMAWLGMGIGNCSITVIQVRPDGTARLMAYSDVGHLPTNLQTGYDSRRRELLVPPAPGSAPAPGSTPARGAAPGIATPTGKP